MNFRSPGSKSLLFPTYLYAVSDDDETLFNNTENDDDDDEHNVDDGDLDNTPPTASWPPLASGSGNPDGPSTKCHLVLRRHMYHCIDEQKRWSIDGQQHQQTKNNAHIPFNRFRQRDITTSKSYCP